MNTKLCSTVGAIALAMLLPACAAKIHGTVQLVGANKQPMAKEGLHGTVVNMEASRIGYETDTQTVEIKEHTRKKIEFKLRQIQEGTRKTIQGSRSDEDKIINPGEVNIQAPTL